MNPFPKSVCCECGDSNWNENGECLTCHPEKIATKVTKSDVEPEQDTYKTVEDPRSHWYCYMCDTQNYGFHTKCVRCGAER